MLINMNLKHFKLILTPKKYSLFMKKLLTIFVCLLVLISCDSQIKDFATVSGKITNAHTEKTLQIFNRNGYNKIIAIKDDGTFNDTLKIETGDYSFKHGDKYGVIFLKNNNTSTFSLDYQDFENTLVFDGDDADNNNFGIEMYKLGERNFTSVLFDEGGKADLDNAVNTYKTDYENLKNQLKNIDSLHIANADNSILRTIKSVEQYFNSKFELREAFPKGLVSPVFTNYENHKGGTTSLTDLKGKYVYIDVWATWCAPCKAEIPFLKKIEAQYQGKNIDFVSISIDEDKNHEAWKKMIVDKNLGGIQLFADNNWMSKFIKDYKINGIPRFILIDPNGKIVTADAPRPSDESIIELFKELNI
jgi:thiol-disulfide isomerase/thioredoxin